jgi:hypothetical protein
MPVGTNTPIRRAQLIAPFGPGAMVVVRGGTSLIAAGLDHWFEREDGSGIVDVQEFRISEWRLERSLHVGHFRLPPDHRTTGGKSNVPNTFLTVPFLRFPQWYFCPVCHLLQEFPLSRRGKVKCPECEAKKKYRQMFQVPFVALCDRGHIQDFPWREWAHKAVNPTCQRPLRLIATGSASLSGQKVECDCGASRTLSSITDAKTDGTTYLSQQLAGGTPFLCRGRRPWLGPGADEPCSRPIRGSLRNAANVYYAQVRSAIYLPRGSDPAQQEIIELLEAVPLSSLVELLRQLGASVETILSSLRKQHPTLLQSYRDEQIAKALQIVLDETSDSMAGTNGDVEAGSQEVSFRQAEFDALRTVRDEQQLRIQASPIDQYDRNIAKFFGRVMLVDKLRETRVLAGFTRIFPENDQLMENLRDMLWQQLPSAKDLWLPAYTVYGEGIFLELDEMRLQRWERRS